MLFNHAKGKCQSGRMGERRCRLIQKGVVAALAVGIFCFSCYGEVVFTPPYDNCFCWSKDSAALGEAESNCNRYTGAVGVYASSGVGGASTAEAQQYITVSVPGSGERQISVEVEIVRSGGASTFGAGAFAGTEKTWSVGSDDNYHRQSVDDWLNFSIALDKIGAVLGCAAEGSVIVEAIAAVADAAELAIFINGLLNDGDAETVRIRFDHTVPAGVDDVDIWAGLRANASGFLTGTGYGISVGQVTRFTIYGVDPPCPPILGGTRVGLSSEAAVLIVENPAGNGGANCWVDWGESGPCNPEFIGFIGDGNDVWEYHIYNEPGQYTIRSWLARTDGTSSLESELDILMIPEPPSSVAATDCNYTDKIRISWDMTDANDVYRVYRADSPSGPKIALGNWQSETSYDDCSAWPETDYYYWVRAGDGRYVTSSYSSESFGRRTGLDYDLDDSGYIDYEDLGVLAGYWLDSGVGMADEIISDDEIINFHHFCSYAAQYGGLWPPVPDTEAPTVPTGVEVVRVTDTAAEISWVASVDSTGVAGYNVHREDRYGNQVLLTVDTTRNSVYIDTTLDPLSSAGYRVSAFDEAGNHSGQSEQVFAYTDAGADLVVNGSFETSPCGEWMFYSGTRDTAASAHYGEACLRADSPGSASPAAAQVILPLARSDYILSGWVKSQDIIYGIGLYLTVERYDSAEKQWFLIGSTLSQAVKGTADWTYQEAIFTTPRDFEAVRVTCRGDIVDGTGWFDDIKVVPAQ